MERTIIVLMEKEKETGNFIREIESYDIEKSELISSLYAINNEGELDIYLTLSTERDLEEWEYTAFYDYIDLDSLKGLYDDVEELDDTFNPAFKFKLSYSEEGMEEKLNNFVDLYFDEVSKVYDEIKDLKEEYI